MEIIKSFRETPGAAILDMKSGIVIAVDRKTGSLYQKDPDGETRGIAKDLFLRVNVSQANDHPQLRWRINLFWKSEKNIEEESVLGYTNRPISARNWCDIVTRILGRAKEE